jgi:catechol 2,3-dioxygenase-like lactoylglutathione lyase family enzyme
MRPDDSTMTAQPILDQLNIVVDDMEAMAAFYERLGLTLQTGPPAWARHHRDTGTAPGVHLELDSKVFAPMWNAGWTAGRTGTVIGFRLPSRDAVDRLFEGLTADGYSGQQAPYDAFWGARYALIEDPDGNTVGLMSPIDRSLATAPPEPPA